MRRYSSYLSSIIYFLPLSIFSMPVAAAETGPISITILMLTSGMFAGAFLMIAVYATGMWSTSRNNSSYLLLAAGAAVASLQLIHRAGLMTVFFEESTPSFLWSIGWSTVFCIAIIWPNYLNSRFNGLLNPLLVQGVSVAAALGLILAIFTSSEVFVGYGSIFRLVMIPYCIYIFIAIAWRLRQWNKVELRTFAAFLLLLLSALLDSIVYSMGFKPYINFQSVGFVIFVLMELSALATMHRRYFEQTIILQQQLKSLNNNIENKVHERTQDLATANIRLNTLALTDALTNLPNRRHFDQQLCAEIDRATQYKNNFSLLILDIDHFKQLNDTYGHDVGDAVLQALGAMFNTACRKSDLIARIGGEEFALIARDTDLTSAHLCAQALRQKVAELKVIHNGAQHSVRISVGLAVWKPSLSSQQLIKLADQALYRAKRQGRDQVSV